MCVSMFPEPVHFMRQSLSLRPRSLRFDYAHCLTSPRHPPISTSPALGPQVCTSMLDFLCGFWGSDSGSHAANTFLMSHLFSPSTNFSDQVHSTKFSPCGFQYSPSLQSLKLYWLRQQLKPNETWTILEHGLWTSSINITCKISESSANVLN